MAEPSSPQSTVSTDATTTIRQRPTVLLMVARVRAAEATLDLGLAQVARRAADAVRRLTRLGAARAWAGEAHLDDHADPDPLARMRASARRRPPAAAQAERPGVNVTVAATWDIAGLPAEGVLTLVDRLRIRRRCGRRPVRPARRSAAVGRPDGADPEDDGAGNRAAARRPVAEVLVHCPADRRAASPGRGRRVRSGPQTG